VVAAGAKTRVALPDQAWRLKDTARCRAAPVVTAVVVRLQALNGVNLARVASETLVMVLEAIRDEIVRPLSYHDRLLR